MVKKLQKSYFDVLGICCSSEVPFIESILKPIEGVEKVTVNITTRTVIVVHDSLQVSQLEILKALNQAKLEANIKSYGSSNYRNKWPSLYAVASGVLLALSFLKYAFRPLQYLALGAVVVGIWPILLKSFVALKSFRLDINILMLIAVAGTIALRDYTEPGTIVFLFVIAEWLQARASDKASATMSQLMELSPRKAVLAETGEEVDVDEVKLNTLLAVKAGEVIPIDGIIVDGKCEVDEKTLTGESFPVTKEKDSTVFAGTINLNGYICMKTTAMAEDCVVSKMAKLVEEAQSNKSSTERFVDKCAKYYTPAVIVISVAIALIPLAFRVHNPDHWLHLALVVLVSACPCALILSTPVATFCALAQAAATGLLVKGADYLEIFSKVKIVAFDKTGTITRGEFVVVDFECLCDNISLNTLLFWVSSIESKSSHPMASALVEHAKSLSVEPKSESVEDYENFPGEGICGKIDGSKIYIGNRKIAERARGTVEERMADEIKTTGFVYCGATLVGTFSLSDACRTGAAEAISELKSMGIKTAMLTGDNNASAMRVNEQLGRMLDMVHAELLPEDKSRLIQDFKKEGKVAMIGDGINDAPALATADIGISMGISGSALATETGHIILMSNDIRKIPKALRLAKRTHQKVITNVILSIITKGAVLAFAFAVHPLVWLAVLADVGTCLLVIFNSMLLLRGSQRKISKCSSAGHCNSSSEAKAEKKCGAQKCASKACGASKLKSVTCSDSCAEPCGGDKKSTCCDHGGNSDHTVKNDETDLHDLLHSCCPESCPEEDNECCSEPCDAGASNSHSGTKNHVSLCMEDKCRDSVEQQLDGGKASEILRRAEHVHEHGHEHGHDHQHDNEHEHDHQHGHGHAHEHQHGHDHAHEHLHRHGHAHEHLHGHGHAHEHGHDHEHEHGHDHEHKHDHEHEHKHDHEHEHGYRHEHHHVHKCCSGHVEPLHSNTSVSVATNQVLVHSCGLRKREVRCCRKYVKSCCSPTHFHGGHGFGGSLTEIVTE